MRRVSYSLFLLSLFLLGTFSLVHADVEPEPTKIEIFFSAGCADCWPYTEEVLIPAITIGGSSIETNIHDYTIPDERQLLSRIVDEIELPRSIADSLYAFIPRDDGVMVILGHVPFELIESALKSPNTPKKLVIWQPKMHGDPFEYKLWAWKGDVQTFSIKTPYEEALTSLEGNVGQAPVGLANLEALLPTVILTGLVDSVNPCAFAVILLLIAFLFTLRQSRGRILQLGLVYIGMIFIVYFGIGLGLLRVVKFSDDPHFIARAGSWLLIGLGMINLFEFLFPNFPIKLHMPSLAGERANELIKKASLPATIAAGFLVGLCTFPCSGGIYVSVITLLNAKTTMSWGLGYLALYNLMFVLPLIIILFSIGNRTVAKKWAGWERKNSRKIRLWYGLVMVFLGLGMLFVVI